MFQKKTKQMIEPMLLNTRQAATLLNISERTVFSLIKEGKLPSVKIGRCLRFSVADLEAFIAQAREEHEDDRDSTLHSVH